MAGIVRASDRVAVWHEAAENFPSMTVLPEKPPTSTPPQGASAVTIPNTNKFKTPANGLAKLLATIPDNPPKPGVVTNNHMQLADWLSSHQPFVNTYFKPNYAPALKAHLGEANYAKLVSHAPKSINTALTTHTQLPAPNSNKFKTPANGLKKLLADPNTTPNHVKQWIDSHPSFHGYLGPQYADALKGVLGQDYDSWKEHLSPTPPVTSVNPKVGPVQVDHDTVLGPADKPTLSTGPVLSSGFSSWLKTKGHDPAKLTSNPAYGDTLKMMHKKYQQEQGLGASPKFTPEDLYDAAGKAQAAPESAWKPSSEHEKAVQKAIDKIKKDIGPPPTPDTSGNIEQPDHAADIDSIKKMIGEPDPSKVEMGGPPESNALSTPSPAYQDFLKSVDKGVQSGVITFKKHKEFQSPQFQQWFEQKDKLKQKGFTNDPGAAVGYYNSDTNQSSDDDEAQKIKDLQDKIQTATPAGEPAAPKKSFGEMAAEIYPHAFGHKIDKLNGWSPKDQQEYLKGWIVSSDDPAKKQQLQTMQNQLFGPAQQAGATPGEEGQDWYDKYFDQPSQASDQDEISKIKQQQPAPQLNEQQALAAGIKKIFPNTPLDVDNMSTPALKQQLEDWQKHLADTPALKPHLDQINQLYHQTFGGGPAGQQPPAAALQPGQEGMLDAWKKEHPDTPSGGNQQAWAGGAAWAEWKQIHPHAHATSEHFFDNPGDAKAWVGSHLSAGDEKTKAFHDKWFGKQQSAPGDPAVVQGHPSNLKSVLEQQMFTPDSNNVKTWMDMSPQDAKAKMDSLAFKGQALDGHKISDELSQKWQGIYNQVYGQPGNGGSDQDEINAIKGQQWDKTKTPTKEQIMAAGGVNELLATQISQQTPEKFWHNYELVKSKPEEYKNMAWGKIVQYGEGQGGAGQPATPSYDPEQLKKEWLQHWPGDGDKFKPGGELSTPEATKAWVQSLVKTYSGEKHDFLKKTLDQLTNPQQQPAGPPTWDPAAFAEEYKKVLPGTGSSLASGTVDSDYAKNKLQALIENYPDTPQSVKLQELKDKWFGGGAPAAPAYDKDAVWEDWKKIYPHSPNKENFDTPEQAMKWVKSKAAWSDSSTYSISHKKIHQFYDKWFGKDAPAGGAQAPPKIDPEVEAIKAEQAKLGPPEPIKPFKSEKPQAADLKKWSTNKPETPYGWKNFATWWGNTKLTPKQETGLYKSWFGKDTTPEAANKWFGGIFQQQAVPSDADLGAQGTPAWAHASWAFGNNAEKEWPLFSQWAANEPGLPKGTSIKQKLNVWQGLDPKEKNEITQDYAPEKQVDKAAIISELTKAYPDSDWSTWSKMSQGQLEKSMSSLAQSGYKPIIPIYNKAFGQNVPMPPAEDKAKPVSGQPIKLPTIDPSTIPKWALSKWGYNGGPQTQAGYAAFLNFAKSVGKLDEVKAFEQPDKKQSFYGPKEVTNAWDSMSAAQKYQFLSMSKTPWSDLDSLKTWQKSQPALGAQLHQIYPDKPFDQYYWDTPGYESTTKGAVENLLDKETDPAKKKALLDIYMQQFGQGKLTLGQTLNSLGAPPAYLKAKNWDTWLQTHTSDDIVKMLKKQIKAEPDPDKWVGYVDALYKHFKVPSGNKVVTNYVGKNFYGQGLAPSYLQALHAWKKNGADPNNYPSYPGSDYNAGPYAENKKNTADLSNLTSHPKWYGWTPPTNAGTSYTMDPALFGQSSTRSYTIPPEESAKTPDYEKLLENAKKWDPKPFSSDAFSSELYKAVPDLQKVPGWKTPTNPADAKAQLSHILNDYTALPQWSREGVEDLWDKYFTSSGLSDKDKQTLNSPAFQQWFDGAGPDYKKVMGLHPGNALDDYSDFMKGGPLYSEVPKGTGKDTHYDLTPYHFLPFTKDQGGPKKVYFSPKSPPLNYDPHKSYESEINDDEPMWPGFTKNPMRPDKGRRNDPLTKFHDKAPGSYGQEDLVLPPGETMEPQHDPIHLHRGMSIQLGKYDENPPQAPPSYLKTSDPKSYAKLDHKYQLELHRKWLLDQIRYRLQGSQGEAKEQVPDLFNTAEDPSVKNVPVPSQWEYNKPSGISGVFDFNKWAKDNKVPPEQIWSLAKKWGADNPDQYGSAPFSEGPWTHGIDPKHPEKTDPGFAKLLLDYLEATDYGSGAGYAPPGSLGDHWSVGLDAPKGFSGGGDMGVIASGDWGGQGENPTGAHAVVSWGGDNGEKEINLSPGAPVKIHRVRVRLPGNSSSTWLDIPVEPHMRYAKRVPEQPRQRHGVLTHTEMRR